MERFEIIIPTPEGEKSITVKPGSSVIFVGANGSGKSRLAVYIEEKLGAEAHRLSAHRAQDLPKRIKEATESDALSLLKSGGVVKHQVQFNAIRSSNRWGSKPNTGLLTDFHAVVQALYAEHTRVAFACRNNIRAGRNYGEIVTKFERLCDIWEQLLPHRHLEISANEIKAKGKQIQDPYNASELSDGERAIFYMIGQTLLVDNNSLLIIDEPELHMHRSLMSKLWDALEALRKDVTFVFITHDLEFAASRSAKKFIIGQYEPAPCWSIVNVPEDTGFDEELTTLILGSRHPILFVEGDEKSLDVSFYRCCFPGWTVIPTGPCENVIHSVVTMRSKEELTRITCSGIVDADAREVDDIGRLDELGIAVLPVSEIENMILLLEISRAIAMHEGYKDAELERKLCDLKKSIFATLNEKTIEDVIAS